MAAALRPRRPSARRPIIGPPRRVTMQSKKAAPASRAIVVAEAIGIMGERLAVAPPYGPARKRRIFVSLSREPRAPRVSAAALPFCGRPAPQLRGVGRTVAASVASIGLDIKGRPRALASSIIRLQYSGTTLLPSIRPIRLTRLTSPCGPTGQSAQQARPYYLKVVTDVLRHLVEALSLSGAALRL